MDQETNNTPEEIQGEDPIVTLEWGQAKRFILLSVIFLVAGLVLSWIYRPLLVSLLVSFTLAFLLAPLVDQFQPKKAPRWLVASVFMLITLAIIGIATVLVLPKLYAELMDLIALVPKVFESATTSWIPALKKFILSYDLTEERELDQFIAEFKSMGQISERLEQALVTVWSNAPRVIGSVVNIIIIPLITFFFLKDLPAIQYELLRLVPPDLKDPARKLGSRIARTLRQVLKGQFMVAGILGGFYLFGFWLIGLPNWIMIGVVSGMCRLVPYLDVIVGGSFSLIVLLSDYQGVGRILAMIGVFLIAQSLDGMFLTPKVLGSRLGLHPLVVIVSVIAFGNFWGFWGVLLAIPVVAITKVLWITFIPFYYRSRLYKS